MKAHARLFSVLAALALATSSASADPLVIYQTSGELSDTGTIAGTTRGLSVNLPGATWSCGTIWNWSRPTYAWSYTDLGNAINCGEEYAGAVLPLASTGDYVRPSLIRIDVTFFSSQGASCVGFWNTEPYEWYEDEDGTHNFNVGGTIACGIVYTTSTRTLQVAENGALVGSAVSVFADNANGLHSLSLLADTSTGELLAVWWDGARVQGLSSMAFTEAATTYAAARHARAAGSPSATSRSRRANSPTRRRLSPSARSTSARSREAKSPSRSRRRSSRPAPRIPSPLRRKPPPASPSRTGRSPGPPRRPAPTPSPSRPRSARSRTRRPSHCMCSPSRSR